MPFARSLTLVLHLISHTIGLTGAASMRAHLFEGFAYMVRTPIEIWQLHAVFGSNTRPFGRESFAAKVLYHLVRKSDNWSVVQHDRQNAYSWFITAGIYQVIAGIANIEDINDRGFSLGLVLIDVKHLTSPQGWMKTTLSSEPFIETRPRSSANASMTSSLKR
jgi:hypothetical protein